MYALLFIERETSENVNLVKTRIRQFLKNTHLHSQAAAAAAAPSRGATVRVGTVRVGTVRMRTVCEVRPPKIGARLAVHGSCIFPVVLAKGLHGAVRAAAAAALAIVARVDVEPKVVTIMNRVGRRHGR